MRRIGKSRSDDAYLRALGKHLEAQIKRRGYASIYEFWIETAGDDISRATLNGIVAGKTDVKICTLKTIARLLRVPLKELVDFKE